MSNLSAANLKQALWETLNDIKTADRRTDEAKRSFGDHQFLGGER